LCKDSPVELEEIGLKPIHMARKAGMEPIKGAPNEAHKLEGVLLDIITTSIPTKGIASIKPTSGAIEATTVRPKILELREKCVEWSKL
jgi:hypothetical protein